MAIIKIDFFDKSVSLWFSEERNYFAGTDKRIGVILVGKVYLVFIGGEMSVEWKGFGLINELNVYKVAVFESEGIGFNEEFGKEG